MEFPCWQGRIKWTQGSGQSRDCESPKCLAQLRSVSHTLISTLQKHRSKLIRFDSLHFRDNWWWPCTAVHMWLICSKRKLYHKETIFLALYHYTTFFVIDPLTIFTAQIVHSHMDWGQICLPTVADENVHDLEKNVLNKISLKTNLNRTTWLSFCDGSFTVVTPINCFVM